MIAEEQNAVWRKHESDMFETFAVELEEFTQTGKEPSRGSQDVRYALALQERRLRDKGLVLKYDFMPRGHFASSGGASKNWSDDRYTSKLEYRTCRVNRKIYREQKKIFEQGENSYFYQIITNAWGRYAAAEKEHACLNCGAVSPIKVLEGGCPYCGTVFKISEQYPKITNFYFVKDVGGTKAEVTRSILKISKPIMLAVFLFALISYLGNPDMNWSILLCILVALFAGVVFGGALGYDLWAVRTLISLFWNAGKSAAMLVNVMGSEKRFVNRMKRYSGNFSYEYFMGKVVSILKMILFSEDAGELSCYAGTGLGNRFEDLIDASFCGAMAVKHFSVKNNCCYVLVEVYMEDLYEDNGRVQVKDEKFRMSLQKKLNKPIDLHFSIMALHCRSCGKGFDATRQKCCPSCGTRYEMLDEDWVVTGIRRA